jgi:tetratricopeptide (TPR) repeat protein
VRTLLFIVLLSGFASVVKAQFEPQNPTQLIVRVCLDSYQNPAPQNLIVQLRDGFGGLEHEGHTDTRGVVEFSTFTANKRLRIYGPGIVEHEETIEIEQVETRKLIMVIVKSHARSPSVPMRGETIPSGRLAVPERAQKEFQRGSEALAKSQWAKAQQRFDAAIGIYPDYDVAYNGLGVALMGMGDSKSARPAFERAIHFNDGFAEAYRNLAKIALSDRNYEEADTLLTRSLSADPLNAWALAYSAYAELQLHKFDEAIAHAQTAHGLPHKGLASTHIVAALALESSNRQGDALVEYRTYLEEEPNGRDAGRAKEKILRLSAK